MNRQYVGARYVVKVYENSQNPSSAEWEQNVNYEPLTMVTYNYGTYVSKKSVPSNIGNPSENGAYWTQTGFYNGQIATLEAKKADKTNLTNISMTGTTATQNVENGYYFYLNGVLVKAVGDITSGDTLVENTNYTIVTDGALNEVRITTQRRIIACGDSYLMDYTDSWGHQLQTMLGLSNSDFYYGGLSGGGFISQVGTTDGNGFLTGMQSIENNVSSPNTITDIIVCGGLNDSQYDPASFPLSTFSTHVADFISYCNAHYPNAKIWIGYCGNAADSVSVYINTRTIDNRLYAIQKYSEIESTKAIAINTEIWKVFTFDYSLFNSGDFLHPSTSGSKAIAQAIMSWITGSPFSVKRGAYKITRSGVLEYATTQTFEANNDNGTLKIKLNPSYQQPGLEYTGDFVGRTGSTLVAGTGIKIGATSDGPIFNKDFDVLVTMAYGDLLGSQTYIPAILKFKKGTDWMLYPITTSNIASGTNLFIIGAQEIVIPAEYYV